MNAMAVQAGSKKRFKVKDFLLEFSDDEKVAKEGGAGTQQPWQKMKFIAQMFVAQANADADKKKKRR